MAHGNLHKDFTVSKPQFMWRAGGSKSASMSAMVFLFMCFFLSLICADFSCSEISQFRREKINMLKVKLYYIFSDPIKIRSGYHLYMTQEEKR